MGGNFFFPFFPFFFFFFPFFAQVCDVFNPYRYYRNPIDEWEENANAVFYVEDARTAFQLFCATQSIPNAPELLKLATVAFEALSEVQRNPFKELAQQDAERHYREIQRKNEYFLPNSDWPRFYNSGMERYERCLSCFCFGMHLPECQLHGYEHEEEGEWERHNMTKEDWNSMMLLDIYLDRLKDGPPRLCNVSLASV